MIDNLLAPWPFRLGPYLLMGSRPQESGSGVGRAMHASSILSPHSPPSPVSWDRCDLGTIARFYIGKHLIYDGQTDVLGIKKVSYGFRAFKLPFDFPIKANLRQHRL